MNDVLLTVVCDSIALLFVSAATASVAYAAYRVCATTSKSLLAAAVAAWILTWSWISGVGQLLGLLSCLTPAIYIGTVLVSGSLASWYAVRNFRTAEFAEHEKPGVGYRTSLTVFWLAIAIGFVFRALYVSVTRHPTQWDSIAYHLPRVGQWTAAHGLHGHSNLKWFYPGTNELLQYWFSGGLSGDFTYAFNNLASVLFLGLGAYGLSRQLNASRLFANLVAVGVTVNYIVVHQALDNKNDIPIAALLIGALFLFSCCDRKKARSYLPIGLALGLMLGIKYYAVAVAIGGAVMMIGAIGLTRIDVRQKATCAAVLLCTLLAVGSGWYLRNWLDTGEPMFPKAIFGNDSSTSTDTLLGTSLIGSISLEVLLAWMNQVYQKLGVVPFLGLLATPSALVGVMQRSGKQGWREVAGSALFGGCLLLCFGLYLITPFTISSPNKKFAYLSYGYITIRLGFPFFVLLTIFSWTQISNAVSDWGRRREVTETVTTRRGLVLSGVPGFVAALLVTAQLLQCSKIYRPGFEIDILLGHYHYATLAASFALSLLIVMLGGLRLKGWSRGQLAFSVAMGISALVLFVATSSIRWHSQFASQYDAYFETEVFSWIENADLWDGADELLVVGHRTYPFAGSRRERSLHQLADMPVYKVPLNTATDLEELLGVEGFRVLVAERHNGLWNRLEFEAHARARPEVYDQLFEDGRYSIYHVDLSQIPQ